MNFMYSFSQIANMMSLILVLLKSINCFSSVDTESLPKRPSIYRWLAQNSYICDPTLLNKRSHRFLAPREATRIRCSCGDPLVTKSACGRKNGARDKPKCFRLPEPCLREYSVIFANGGNRLTEPSPRNSQKTTTSPPRKRPATVIRKTVFTAKKRPHRMPKIVTTIPVTTVLRVRKLKRKQ